MLRYRFDFDVVVKHEKVDLCHRDFVVGCCSVPFD